MIFSSKTRPGMGAKTPWGIAATASFFLFAAPPALAQTATPQSLLPCRKPQFPFPFRHGRRCGRSPTRTPRSTFSARSTFLPQNAAWFQGPVQQAFESADLLVTETMLDSPATLEKVFVDRGMRHDGKTLRESLAPLERTNLEKGLSNLGLPAETFDAFQPWYAGLLLSLLPLKAAGYDQANGVETQIEAKAASSGIARHPLETADYQIGLFADLPEKSQQRYLAEVLEQLPTLREDIAKVVEAWKLGRADELAKLLNEDESDELMRKALITNRNRSWAKWLKTRLSQPGVVFVAVGAGHLAGKGSVQDQLAKAGIRSVRVQ
ncbi:TraB/GumN family protein [Novosphingobium sp. ST904]|uniref:TraB/GumN family protein n=1 Tax=Novosphingobium sp. ST904 TaxID=1684385 RepID=UPI0012E1DDE2|nr:TraB/GumN family protein [Novosphingobium sp. ST904]